MMSPETARRRPRLRAVLIPGLVLALLAGCGIPRWPVEGPVTSPFGLRWSGIMPRVHHGVDIRVPEGTPVHAMAAGQVRFAGRMGGYGNVVWIDHRRDMITVYAHLSRIEVRTGDRIERREVIGLSGSTGSVTAPHLHFEVWKAGRPVNPVPFLGSAPLASR
jgi:murein DD-endopeptidase MepM/ murein hydrolase activator NlpD